MTAEEIRDFGEGYGPHPFHGDEAADDRTRFDGPLTSGLHTLAATNRVVTDEFKPDLAGIAGLGVDDVRYHEPVRPGDVLTPTLEVYEKRRRADTPTEGIIRLKVSVRNADGRVVLSHVETALVKASDRDRL